MSISRAQAAALADGFLDTVGGGDADGIQLRNTFTELFLLAGELAEDAVSNLNSMNKNSSGELSESITVADPTQEGKFIKIDVTMLFYGLFVNSGVKGTRQGSSTANYSFKNEFPSKKMVQAIEDWMDRAKLSTRTVKKYKGYGKHEVKGKSISVLDGAYAIARSVKQRGLKPTGFMDRAIKKTSDKISRRLGAALKVDIIKSLS